MLERSGQATYIRYEYGQDLIVRVVNHTLDLDAFGLVIDPVQLDVSFDLLLVPRRILICLTMVT